jgi:hypothetical protein
VGWQPDIPVILSVVEFDLFWTFHMREALFNDTDK